MISSDRFSKEITACVYSSQTQPAIIHTIGNRLRTLLEAPKEVVEATFMGFDRSLFACYSHDPDTANQGTEPRQHAHIGCPKGDGPENGLCPQTGMPCMVKITYPKSFFAGQFIGQLVRRAFRGAMPPEEFERTVYGFLSGQAPLPVEMAVYCEQAEADSASSSNGSNENNELGNQSASVRW